MKFNAQKDYYAILGVSRSADSSAIQHGYKEMVSRYHPDKHQGNELEDLAREKLIEVNEAYEVLSKPELKADYDTVRSGQKKSAAYSHAGGPAGGPACAPRHAPKASGNTLRKLIGLVAVVAAMPFVLRFVRSPRVLAVIAAAVVLAWFGPRWLKRLKK